MTGGLGAPAGDGGDHRAGGCLCGSPPFVGRLSSEGDMGSGGVGFGVDTRGPERPGRLPAGLAGAGRPPGGGVGLRGCACSDLLFSEG